METARALWRLFLVGVLGCGGAPLAPAESLPREASAERSSASNTDAPWWQGAVFYEVYPRSFQDTDGDGIGDLPGITERLDYLEWLGVDAIWITPFYPSPQVDFGYDVSGYTDVDPTFGTLEDFDRLIAEAHGRHIRVIVDVVLNHSSDQHPWFVEARSGRDSPRRDWYVWSDPATGGGPPTNWASIFEPSAWTLDERSGQYYYHAFYPEQPDLNLRNPEVVSALEDVLRFWLERGVDGFRLDAVAHLFESIELEDNPLLDALRPGGDEEPLQEHVHTMFLPEGYRLLGRLRRLVDAYPGDRVLISEAYTEDAAGLLPFYDDGPTDGVHLPFNFLLMAPEALSAPRFRERIRDASETLQGRPTTWVLGNHDQPRIVDRFDHGGERLRVAKLLALMLLTLDGAPFLYYGDEIGMVTTEPQSIEDVRDPVGRRYWPENKGRDGERTPMQWDGTLHAGFTDGTPWLPIPTSAAGRNVKALRASPGSVLMFYRRALELRGASPVLRRGALTLLDVDPEVLAYRRQHEAETYVVLLNFADEPRTVSLEGVSEVLLDNVREPSRLETAAIQLAPYEAMLLR